MFVLLASAKNLDTSNIWDLMFDLTQPLIPKS